jgi:NADH:ubiquinone oxidoreductase subunit 5 (subunit L)/multisubunit Na+/H+ antiporter MnhA subunit
MTAPVLPADFVPAAPALAAALIALRLVRGDAAVARLATGAAALALLAGAVRCASDPLGGFIATAVAAIALIVTCYATRALSGSSVPFARFFTLIATATAGALSAAVATDLRVLAAAWIVTGLATSGLLGVAPRPAAQFWARRQLLAERAGDVAWIAILAIAWHAYGTFDLAALGRAAAAGSPPVALAFAIVVAGAIRSALVPLHSWLPNSMEAPTPVSAFMHAGVVNGAGVLFAKTAFVLAAAPAALGAAALLGGATALTGAVVALVRPEAKRRLGWSTVAQMGFMVLQCGCGAFAAAVVHLAAHGCYKSTAFLGVGGSIEEHRAARLSPDVRAPLGGAAHAAWSLLPATLGVIGAALLLGGRLTALPAAAMVVAIAWAAGVCAARGAELRATDGGTRARLAGAIGLGVAAYLAAVAGLDAWLGAQLPHLTVGAPTAIVAVVALVAGLLAGLGLRAPASDALYAVALGEGRGPASVPAA